MSKRNLFQNRLFVYLLSIYVVGLIFGLVLMNPKNIGFNNTDKNFFLIFFSNYWYNFLIWIFGFSMLGFVITSIIVFFRAFIFGVLVRILIINSFKTFIIMFVLELLIALPLLMVLSYISLMMSKENLKMVLKNYSNSLNINKYINLMLVVTVVIAIYSLIIFLN